MSRFARNTVDSLTTIRELKGHGVECYFEKENSCTFDGKGGRERGVCVQGGEDGKGNTVTRRQRITLGWKWMKKPQKRINNSIELIGTANELNKLIKIADYGARRKSADWKIVLQQPCYS